MVKLHAIEYTFPGVSAYAGTCQGGVFWRVRGRVRGRERERE
jgi:hypothetical protein